MSKSGSTTLSRLLWEYELWAEVSPCTKTAVGVAARRLHAFFCWLYAQDHQAPAPGDFDPSVVDITPRHISHFRTWLIQGERDGYGGWRRRPVSAHTVHSYHASLRQLFRYGRELTPPLIVADPMAGIRNRRPEQPEPDVWSRSEIAALLEAVRRIRWRDPTMRIRWTAILYGLLHGQRINEITTLRRIDLRPQEGLVLIRARGDEPGRWWRWETKGRRDRALGISRQYARALRRLLAGCPWMFPHLSRRACARRLARIGDLSWRQRQCPYTVVNRDFRDIVAQANVVRLEKGQPMIAAGYLHVGRQTAATELARRRVHPKVAATIMGWASVETGNRHYIKVEQAYALCTSRACFAAIGRSPELGNKDSNLD
jgi:integrase